MSFIPKTSKTSEHTQIQYPIHPGVGTNHTILYIFIYTKHTIYIHTHDKTKRHGTLYTITSVLSKLYYIFAYILSILYICTHTHTHTHTIKQSNTVLAFHIAHDICIYIFVFVCVSVCVCV